MGIMFFLPKLTKALPSALMAILAVTTIVYLFHINTRVVSDMMMGHEAAAGLPSFAWLNVPLTLETFKIIK